VGTPACQTFLSMLEGLTRILARLSLTRSSVSVPAERGTRQAMFHDSKLAWQFMAKDSGEST
jgi:hypothetical protein